MFININDNCFTPTKQEVANTSTKDHAQAQPDVVSHEDQHQTVTDEHLDHVEHRLHEMTARHHVQTANITISTGKHAG